jgi:hypothetical protein
MEYQSKYQRLKISLNIYEIKIGAAFASVVIANDYELWLIASFKNIFDIQVKYRYLYEERILR